jgi:hypothetical protein
LVIHATESVLCPRVSSGSQLSLGVIALALLADRIRYRLAAVVWTAIYSGLCRRTDVVEQTQLMPEPHAQTDHPLSIAA